MPPSTPTQQPRQGGPSLENCQFVQQQSPNEWYCSVHDFYMLSREQPVNCPGAESRAQATTQITIPNEGYGGYIPRPYDRQYPCEFGPSQRISSASEVYCTIHNIYVVIPPGGEIPPFCDLSDRMQVINRLREGEMHSMPRGNRQDLVTINIDKHSLEFWRENGTEVWTAKQGEYPKRKFKVFAIVNGDLVRYPGLPLDLGLRLNKRQQILEVA